MDTVISWIVDNWQYLTIGTLAVDKVVALSPTKYDDLIWTAIKGVGSAFFKGKGTAAIMLATACCLLPACAGTTTGGDGIVTSYPDACYAVAEDGSTAYAESVILETLNSPTVVKTAIGTAVMAGVVTDKIDADDVLAVTYAVRSLLEADNTYSALASLVAGEVDNKQVSAVLSILSATGLLDELQAMTDVNVSVCDVALLTKLLDYVDALVEPYAEDAG